MLLRCGADVSILQEFDEIDFNQVKRLGEDRWRLGKSKRTTPQNHHPSRDEEKEEEEEAMANTLFAFVPGYWQAVATSDIAAVRKLVNSW